MSNSCRACTILVLLCWPVVAWGADRSDFKQGLDALKQGDPDLALACFNAVLKASPKHAAALHQRGKAYLAKKEFDLALADLNEAIQLRPKLAEPYVDRGRVSWVK